MEASGFSIAESEYARKRREIFNFVKDLRALGADTDIGIPQIAVIGAQSAGKSSLVEAVTGISVPRDSGTCTRCPMECTILTTTGDWNCQISYRRDNHTSTPFSPLLTSKTDVDIWIRRAQAAILSPHANPDSFKTMNYQQLRDLTNSQGTVEFSKDVVVVDIEDPEGTDLSFVDLPGLMQNENQDMIDLVQGLVEQYINDESTIIIVTIPATDDMENQQAVRLARVADPDGERTIAVVTKPDSLSAGATGVRERWRDIVLGKSKKSYQLKLGYFVVRLPDDDERAKNLTRTDLEKLAKQFFDSHAPWNNPLLSDYLGIPNFIDHISRVLMKIIQDSLPRLKEQVQAKLAECVQDMSKLPAEVTVDATTEILSRISSFCADLRGDVYGLNESKRFVHRTQSAFKKFKLTIRGSAPDFRPFTNPSAYIPPSPPASESDELDEDLREVHPEGSPTKPMGLIEVRKVIKESIGWELPHNVPFEAKKRLIKRFIDQWPAPAQACFDEVLHILSAFVDANIRKHFEQFPALGQYLGPIIRNEIVKCSKDGWRSVASVLECEKAPYITQNGHYLESSRTSWLTHYKQIRRNPERYYMNRPPPQPVFSHEEVVCISPAPGSRASTPLSPPVDQYEEELIVMADVRAYFQVAYKRVIDHVPMTVQRHLNQELSDGLQTQLVAKLELGTSDASQRLADLLAEDPTVKALRAHLLAKKNRLEEMQVKLDNFVI